MSEKIFSLIMAGIILLGGNGIIMDENKNESVDSKGSAIELIIHPVGGYGIIKDGDFKGKYYSEEYHFILGEQGKLTVFYTGDSILEKIDPKTVMEKTLTEEDHKRLVDQTNKAVDNVIVDEADWDDAWEVTLLFQGEEYSIVYLGDKYYINSFGKVSELKILADMFIEISEYKVVMRDFA